MNTTFQRRSASTISTFVLLLGLFLSVPVHAGDSPESLRNGSLNEIDTADHDLPFDELRVALLDSGINKDALDYPDVYNIKTQKSFVSSSSGNEKPEQKDHATNILQAFTVFAHARPDIYDLKIRPEQGRANIFDVVSAVDWLLNLPEERQPHLALLNTAIVKPKGHENVLHSALKKLHEAETTIIVPAGNQGRKINGKQSKIVPAAFPETITFSALTIPSPEEEDEKPNQPGKKAETSLQLASFSNYGTEVDLTFHLDFTDPNDTSYAASTGAFAAMNFMAEAIRHGAREDITPENVRNALLKKAEYPEEGWKNDPDGKTEGLVDPRTHHNPHK